MNFLNKALTAGALAAAALVAAPASAAVVGTIPDTAGSNQFINKFFPGQKIEGWYGADLYLSGGPATIQVEYFGAEAGYINTFNYTGCGNVTHNGSGGSTGTFSGSAPLSASNASTICSVLQNAGLLPFSFLVNSGNPGPVNGANPNDFTSNLANFFVSFDNNYLLDTTIGNGTAGSGQSVFLFLDDGGAGVGGDDNHDDMVLRLSIANGGTFQVPEPTSIALLGVALLGLGASRRKNAANAAK